jgi:hypothetical protein
MINARIVMTLAAAASLLILPARISRTATGDSPRSAQTPATPKGSTMSVAKGIFTVKTTPQPVPEGGYSGIARLLLDKQFHGDLEGTSKGQMLASGGPGTGSGGYVAIEKVTGTLAGRKGGFALQHLGTMQAGGNFQLAINVVPDSGTGELTGLSGKFSIDIKDGQHFYTFEYALPAAQ